MNLVTLLLLICNANDNKNNDKMGLLHLTCKKLSLSMSFIIRLDPKSRHYLYNFGIIRDEKLIKTNILEAFG